MASRIAARRQERQRERERKEEREKEEREREREREREAARMPVGGLSGGGALGTAAAAAGGGGIEATGATPLDEQKEQQAPVRSRTGGRGSIRADNSWMLRKVDE